MIAKLNAAPLPYEADTITSICTHEQAARAVISVTR